MKRLAVGRSEKEWRDLISKKAPLLWYVDVLKPGQSYAVEVNDLVLLRRES